MTPRRWNKPHSPTSRPPPPLPSQHFHRRAVRQAHPHPADDHGPRRRCRKQQQQQQQHAVLRGPLVRVPVVPEPAASRVAAVLRGAQVRLWRVPGACEERRPRAGGRAVPARAAAAARRRRRWWCRPGGRGRRPGVFEPGRWRRGQVLRRAFVPRRRREVRRRGRWRLRGRRPQRWGDGEEDGQGGRGDAVLCKARVCAPWLPGRGDASVEEE